MAARRRGHRAAPVDPDSRFINPSILAEKLFSEPAVILGLAGILAAVYAIQFILTTLADAGAVGEVAAALREDRDLSVTGLIRQAIRLFDRIAALKIIYHLTMVLILGATALFATAVWWMVGPSVDPADPREACAVIGSLLLLFGMPAAAAVAAVLLVATGAVASVALDRTPVFAAVRVGLAYLGRHSRPVLNLYAFLIVIVMWLAALSFLGDLWWLKIRHLAAGSRWPASAAGAWNLSFGILGEFLWLLVLACQIGLFLRLGRKTEPPKR